MDLITENSAIDSILRDAKEILDSEIKKPENFAELLKEHTDQVTDWIQ